MRLAIVFATHEGQTEKIARFAASALEQQGHEVEVFDVDNAGSLSLDNAEAIILAAPVHQLRHPDSFEATLMGFADRIKSIPTLMLSVSLSAAFPEGKIEAQSYLDDMKKRTGLNPTHEALVAGAIELDRYDYFAMQVVKFVVLRGRDYDLTPGDHEFTDWDALKDTVSAFATQAQAA